MCRENTSFLTIVDDLKKKRKVFDWATYLNASEMEQRTGLLESYVFNDIDKRIHDPGLLKGYVYLHEV
jgi:hypothetical protein